MFAPLWVYSAVAGAEGPADTSQFRTLTDELDAADVRLAGSPTALNGLAALLANFDARWEAYQADGEDPRHGLKRVRGALKRLPEAERTVITEWLLGLAVRVGAARRVFGEAEISELERKAIKDVAGWLGAEPPELA